MGLEVVGVLFVFALIAFFVFAIMMSDEAYRPKVVAFLKLTAKAVYGTLVCLLSAYTVGYFVPALSIFN